MKKFPLFIVFVLICGLVLISWYQTGLSAVNKNDRSEKMFTIRPDVGVRTVAQELQQDGLIKNPTLFYLYVKKAGLDKKIQAGDFRLSPSMSSKQIAKALTKGTLDIWVTIPEGKRATEIAALLKEKIPTYDPSWDAKLQENEGYLFPDTYLIPRGATIDAIIAILRNTFDERYQQIDTSKTSLSKAQIVTLASMIEREAQHDQDRPLISSVMHNRLTIGMPLQIDATIQYAIGYDAAEGTWWKKGLTTSDLKIASAYNTYTNTGLPPTPICSPGVLALQAAADPAQSNYLFYMTDKNGITHFAATYAQHQANIEKYGL